MSECVCVRERERECVCVREREGEREGGKRAREREGIILHIVMFNVCFLLFFGYCFCARVDTVIGLNKIYSFIIITHAQQISTGNTKAGCVFERYL